MFTKKLKIRCTVLYVEPFFFSKNRFNNENRSIARLYLKLSPKVRVVSLNGNFMMYLPYLSRIIFVI
jgi:hypothetical protein